MKKIGLFGGCFNPPTYAHIQLAQKAIKEFKLDSMIFVPMGDSYTKTGLEKEHHRFNMLSLICKEYTNMQVSDIELNSSRKWYPIDIFSKLTEQYPGEELYFVMGSDNLAKISSWKGYQELVEKYHYIILNREEDNSLELIRRDTFMNLYESHFHILESVQTKQISSTQVRKNIQEKETIHHLIPQEIIKYIEENKLYQ